MADPAPGGSPAASLRRRIADLGVAAFTHCCFYVMRAIVWLPFQIDCLRERHRRQPPAPE